MTSSDHRVADGLYDLRHLNNVIRANALERGLPVVVPPFRPHPNHEPAAKDHFLADLVLCQAALAVLWAGIGWRLARKITR